MSIKELPGAPEGRPCAGVSSQVQPRALDRWNAGVRAAADSDKDRSISVYDVIGYDYWTGEGVTAKRIAAALRGMGAGPVTVNVNSPGGDMTGLFAIYDVMKVGTGALPFPMPWATDPQLSFVETPETYRTLLERARFDIVREENLTAFVLARAAEMRAKAARGEHSNLSLQILVGQAMKERLQNVMAALEAGTIAPTLMLARPAVSAIRPGGHA